MTKKVDDNRLVKLAAYLSHHMGLNFPSERLAELKRGLISAAKDFGFQNVDSCIEWLLSSALTKSRVEILASHLTVGETYFFREKKSLEILKNDILSEIRSRHSGDHCLKIWSAGCASGEEPYSIAISLVEAMPDIADWKVTILATDISPHSLQKAARGIYGKWSFRDCSPQLKQRYFRETKENTFEISPDIKKMVSFAYHNLAEDPYPSVFNNTDAIDVIFCRNVLMYFTPDKVRNAVEKLYHCLVDDGRLIVSSTETSPVFGSKFMIISYPQSTMYKKSRKPEVLSNIETKCLEPHGVESPTISLEPPAGILELDLSSLGFPEPLAVAENTVPTKIDLYQQAEILFKQGKYTEAEKNINEMLKEHPGDSRGMVLLARIQANLGKLTEAAQWCRQGISQDKLNPSYHYLLATILHEQGQITEAAGSLSRAIYLKPDFVLAHFTLGNLTLRVGKLKEASRHFKNALLLLRKYRLDETVPESDGILAGRLIEVINSYVEEMP